MAVNMMLVPYGGKPFEESGSDREDFLKSFEELVTQAYEEMTMNAIYGRPYRAKGRDLVGHREDGSPIYGEILVDTP